MSSLTFPTGREEAWRWADLAALPALADADGLALIELDAALAVVGAGDGTRSGVAADLGPTGWKPVDQTNQAGRRDRVVVGLALSVLAVEAALVADPAAAQGHVELGSEGGGDGGDRLGVVDVLVRVEVGVAVSREVLGRGGGTAQSDAAGLGDRDAVDALLPTATAEERHRAMALAFDPSLTNLDSVCLPDYHQSLVDIAQVASIPQTLTLTDNVPDPRLLAVDITRADGSVQRCTLANGGITFVEATSTQPQAVRFQQACLRRPTDTKVEVKLLCAG